MLKGIPAEISPELMDVLMQMGHGDDLLLADANYPAAANAQRLVRADGHGAITLLAAILKLFPVDTFVPEVAVVMQPVDADAAEPPIWQKFRETLQAGEGREVPLTPIERFEFYERSRTAYAIVSTGERAFYANLLLKKGVVPPE